MPDLLIFARGVECECILFRTCSMPASCSMNNKGTASFKAIIFEIAFFNHLDFWVLVSNSIFATCGLIFLFMFCLFFTKLVKVALVFPIWYVRNAKNLNPGVKFFGAKGGAKSFSGVAKNERCMN